VANLWNPYPRFEAKVNGNVVTLNGRVVAGAARTSTRGEGFSRIDGRSVWKWYHEVGQADQIQRVITVHPETWVLLEHWDGSWQLIWIERWHHSCLDEVASIRHWLRSEELTMRYYAEEEGVDTLEGLAQIERGLNALPKPDDPSWGTPRRSDWH